MSLKTFKFALVGCLVLATTASAATVTMTSTPAVVRSQAQGAGTYNVLDFFWTSAAGATFTNYTVTGLATSGNFADPARLQDDRQINPAAAGQDGNTAGEVDMWANTVWSSAGKVDLGLTATILPDPTGYSPTGSGAAAPFTNFKWDVFDNVQGDDNNLNDDPDNPTAALAPYHIMRALVSETAVGTVDFLAYDTAGPGVATPFTFNFSFGGPPPNTPPVVLPEPPENNPNTMQGDIITAQFDATDAETPGSITFSNAVLGSFAPLFPGGSNPAGAFASSTTLTPGGLFSFDTAGFARGTYTINVTATDAGGLSSSGGGFATTIEFVPEPSTLALLGLAMVSGLGMIRRRNG